MRTGNSPIEEGYGSYAIPATMQMPEPEVAAVPVAPLPASSRPQSPVLAAMPMPAIPSAVMTPDDMMRAYAERTIRSPPPTAPSPMAFNGSGMRTLYSSTPPPVAPSSLYPESAAEDVFAGGFVVPQKPSHGEDNADFGAAR